MTMVNTTPKTTNARSNSRQISKHTTQGESRAALIFSLLSFLCLLPTVSARGTGWIGDKLAFFTEPFTPNVTHRQDICRRYALFRSGELEMRDALQNLSLRPLMAIGDFFHYDYTVGIDRAYPGLMADLMDDLALRAGFTWRDSFGVMNSPESYNRTWTEMLLWGVETYDIAVNWWDHSIERMEKGVAYIEPWFDGSIILINKEEPPVVSKDINLLNWLRPFEANVWILTILTILVSGLVYQFIEYMNDARDERSMNQWFSDNLYLSTLNFSQNFEYAPTSHSGRIFAVSMSIWALVMTATYTANLASLFVEEHRPTLVVESLDQAMALGIPVCTFKDTNADFLIKEKYKKIIRVPKATELEAYQALNAGECDLVAGYKDNWLIYQGNSDYNPDCDLQWVGRQVEVIKSGFAVKADVGFLCTSFIRDVFNLHITQLIADGYLEELWLRHRSRVQDLSCGVYDSVEENQGSRRLGSAASARRRRLKGGGKAAASSSSSIPTTSSSLTLTQMAGTFVLHWGIMFVAVITSILSYYYDQWWLANNKDKMVEEVKYRGHGPIIGQPPRVNTFVVRTKEDSIALGFEDPTYAHLEQRDSNNWDKQDRVDATTTDETSQGSTNIASDAACRHRNVIQKDDSDNENGRRIRCSLANAYGYGASSDRAVNFASTVGYGTRSVRNLTYTPGYGAHGFRSANANAERAAENNEGWRQSHAQLQKTQQDLQKTQLELASQMRVMAELLQGMQKKQGKIGRPRDDFQPVVSCT